jgi:hypothetical protein
MPNKNRTRYAEIGGDDSVIRVIVSDASFVAKLGGRWVQTWKEDGAPHSAKNYAGVGMKFDSGRGAFIAPKPSDDATFDETTCRWVVPVKPIPGAK